MIAAALSGLWLAICAVFFLVMGVGSGDNPDGLRFVITLMAVFLPVAVIWLAASASRSARIMREESARLQAAVDAMRHAYLAQQHGHNASAATRSRRSWTKSPMRRSRPRRR